MMPLDKGRHSLPGRRLSHADVKLSLVAAERMRGNGTGVPAAGEPMNGVEWLSKGKPARVRSSSHFVARPRKVRRAL